MKVKIPSDKALEFIHANKEQLQEAARSLEWVRMNLVPLMTSEGLDWRKDAWVFSVSRERFECYEPDCDAKPEDIV